MGDEIKKIVNSPAIQEKILAEALQDANALQNYTLAIAEHVTEQADRRTGILKTLGLAGILGAGTVQGLAAYDLAFDKINDDSKKRDAELIGGTAAAEMALAYGLGRRGRINARGVAESAAKPIKQNYLATENGRKFVEALVSEEIHKHSSGNKGR